MDSFSNDSQSSNTEPKHKWEDFVNAVQGAKMDFTYKVLVDLTAIHKHNQQNKQPGSEVSEQTIKEIKEKLLSVYRQKIKALDEHFAQREQEKNKEQVEDFLAAIEYEQNFQKTIRSQQLYELESDLNSKLKTIFSNMKNFIQSVVQRIKYQKYLDNQTQINSYVQRQKDVFEEQKGDLLRVIRNHNDEVKTKYINVALGVCSDKQAKITQLKQSNRRAFEQLQKAKKQIEQLTKAQHEICKTNLELNSKILQLRAQRQARVRQARRQTHENRPQNGQNIRASNNIVSQIISSKESINELSVISVPEIGQQSPNLSTKCQIISTDLKTELQAKWMWIILVLLLSVVISLW